MRQRLMEAVAEIGLVALLLGGACDRSGSNAQAARPAAGETGDTTGVRPGIHPSVIYGERSNPYRGDPAAIAEGRRLFVAYNCSGCHGGRAGGGMGPSLRDSAWTNGGSDTQILATIIEGRSAGMPAWGEVIPEAQMWKIIAYIRTLRTAQEPDKVLQ